MKKLILLFLLVPTFLSVSAQTDTEFWFAAPDISSDFNYDKPVMMRITSAGQLCHVTLSQPGGGGMPPQTITIAAGATQSVNLTPWLSNIECGPGNVVQGKGIRIVSDNKISAYYEVNVNGPNPELFALKGQNALGLQFFISSQYLLSNSPTYNPVAYSSFNIVATEDNTQVTINPTKSIVGHAANTPFTITLNRGQTYAAIATSQAAANHLQGSTVTATKPVAVTLSDDLLWGAEYGGICTDMAGDQTVPVNITGTEYIVIRSNLNTPFDKLYITATQNGTSVTQDGVPITTLNAGQSTELTISIPVTRVLTSAPAYAYHLAGNGCEASTAILPKIGCTGSSSVSVTRSTNETFAVTLIVQNGGQGGFRVNGNAAVITAANFNAVPGTLGQYYWAKVILPPGTYPLGTVIQINNTLSIFQEGVLQGDFSGVSYGYFSNFNPLEAVALSATPSVCLGAAIQLTAETIASATYSWTGPNGFNSNAQNNTIPNAALVHAGDYHLTVTVPGCGTYTDDVTVAVKLPASATVNASICEGQSYEGYTTGGTFQNTFVAANGCDSVRTLNLTIKPKAFATVAATICEGQSYEGYTTSGTFLNTFVAANGCDSIRTLNLTVKPKAFFILTAAICEGEIFEGYTTSGSYVNTFTASNGCDSIRTLNLTVKPKKISTAVIAICEGGSYEGYTSTGIYVDVFTGSNGCDSTRTLDLTVKPKKFATVNATICEGQSYEGYTTAGSFVDIFVGSNGCDSTRTLNLAVKPKAFATISATICEGQSYEGYTNSGTFFNLFVAANGCDSLRTLTLTVKPKAFFTLAIAICEGESYEGHTTSGSYVNTFTAANGCDSIRTLNLTVNPKKFSNSVIAICDGESYEGYFSTGTYVDVFAGSNGCDSTRTLDLTVKPKKFATVNATICEGGSYDGHTTAGSFVDIFTGSNGCDSTRTLNLVIKPKSFATITATICNGESYEGHNSSGSFDDVFTAANGCDSIRTLVLTVIPDKTTNIGVTICEGQSYFVAGAEQTEAGIYQDILQAQSGCDSIIITTLGVTPGPAVSLGPDKSICAKASLTLDPGTYATYTWQDGSTNPSFIATMVGKYWVTITDINNCSNTDTMEIKRVFPIPVNFLKPTDSLCQYAQMDLFPLNSYPSYTWSTGSAQPYIVVTNPGQYILTVTDRNDCKGTDTIQVYQKKCVSGVYIPSAFTPNNNALNDNFKASIFGTVLYWRLQVYNRQGELVFSTTDPQKGWNGMFKNSPQGTGVFVWQCYYQLAGDKPMYKKGTVTLIR